MDKDQSQVSHHGLHHEKNHEESALPHVSGNVLEQESSNREAVLDALEAKLFAMAKSRC